MFDKNAFYDFLVEAKKKTYASNRKYIYVESILKGSKQLEYTKDDFFYRDIYFGNKYFTGQEVIYYKDNPIWSMVYSGGVKNDFHQEFTDEIYLFLMKALSKLNLDNPYRGPKVYIEDHFIYENIFSNNKDSFKGSEIIVFEHNKIYFLEYSGGFIKN